MNYAPNRTPEQQRAIDEDAQRWQQWNDLAGDKDILTSLADRLEAVLEPGFEPNIVLTEDETFVVGNLLWQIIHCAELGPGLRRILDVAD
jgi:hypothetical protein